MKWIIAALFSFFSLNLLASPQVSRASLKVDQVLKVRAGLGIATIVEVPETISQIIIGDQSGFKVEYLEKAVTIKPLRPGAKTNLYLITSRRRYDLALETVPGSSAQYIIYVSDPNLKSSLVWRDLRLKTKEGSFELRISKIGSTRDHFIFQGELARAGFFDSKVDGENFWAMSSGRSIPIDSLYLSDRELSKKKPVKFGLAILKRDLKSDIPLTLKFEGDETLEIRIAKDSLWD